MLRPVRLFQDIFPAAVRHIMNCKHYLSGMENTSITVSPSSAAGIPVKTENVCLHAGCYPTSWTMPRFRRA